MQPNRWQRLPAFLTWVLVGLCVAFWGLRLGEDAAGSAPPVAATARPAAVDAAAVVAALGGRVPEAAAAPAAARRLELRGVIHEGRGGVALLAVDGQPARPFAVGSRVGDTLALKAVGRRHAELADPATGAVVQRLEMPATAEGGVPAGLILAAPAAR